MIKTAIQEKQKTEASTAAEKEGQPVNKPDRK